jgi:Pentapeptide repeats (8 copies)
MSCQYRFKHPDRPRQVCDRAARGPLCPWHMHDRPRPFDVRATLCVDVANEEWLEGIVLSDTDLSGLTLAHARLPNADLEAANLSGSILTSACLDGANLRSVELADAHLERASLVGARVHGANCRDANFSDAILRGAQLDGADLKGAGLKGVVLDDHTSIDGVRWEYPKEYYEARFDDAASVFRTLARHARDVSDYRANEYFYRLEMTALHLRAIGASEAPIDVRSKLRVWWRPRLSSVCRWAGWGLHRIVWGYGASPWRTLVWMLTVIIGFGLIYPVLGISGVPCDSSIATRLLAGLALSVVTFPTLGYGNRTALGLVGEMAGGCEALLGSILMSMFLVALATRYVHRG